MSRHRTRAELELPAVPEMPHPVRTCGLCAAAVDVKSLRSVDFACPLRDREVSSCSGLAGAVQLLVLIVVSCAMASILSLLAPCADPRSDDALDIATAALGVRKHGQIKTNRAWWHSRCSILLFHTCLEYCGALTLCSATLLTTAYAYSHEYA